MKNSYVIADVSKEKVVSGLQIVSSYEPFVTFSKLETEMPYMVRMMAFIPREVEEFSVEGPFEKETIETPLGDIHSRTVKIKWAQNIEPTNFPHDLWAVEINYIPIDNQLDDQAIRVVYEYGDPKTTRGTVTTSANAKV